MRLLLKWLIIVAALFAAALVVPGIRVLGNAWIAFGVTAAILGLVNVTVKPLLKLLTCPVIVFTLGLFLLVINALMLSLAAGFARVFGVGVYVDGFGSAFLGGVVVSCVTIVLEKLLPEPKKTPPPATPGARVTDAEIR